MEGAGKKVTYTALKDTVVRVKEGYGYSPPGHLIKPGQTVELKEGDKMDGVNLVVVEVEQ